MSAQIYFFIKARLFRVNFPPKFSLSYTLPHTLLNLTPRAPYGSGRVGSTALPDPKHRVGSGNGSKRVRMGQTGLKFDKSVILEYLDEYRSNRNDFTVIGFVLMRRIQ